MHAGANPRIHIKWEVYGKIHGCWQTTTWKVSQIVNHFLAHLCFQMQVHKKEQMG